MFGFEEAAPTPVTVSRCGQVLVQAGPGLEPGRPDGGPDTEVVEVGPTLPGYVETPLGSGCFLPEPGPTREERVAACRAHNQHLKLIRRRARKLSAVLRSYAKAYRDDDPCGCHECDYHHSKMCIVGDCVAYAFQADQVYFLADQFVRPAGAEFGPRK